MTCVCLDIGHASKLTTDRGATWEDYEETEVALRYVVAADRNLRARKHTVLLFPGLGTYADRIARAAAAGADLYVQAHLNSGLQGRAGDYGLVIYDHRSSKGCEVATAVAVELAKVCPWPVRAVAARPDDDGQSRDEDYSEAYACISAAYALKPCAILLEPGFLDGALGSTWLLEHADTIGAAIAAGVASWSSRGQ